MDFLRQVGYNVLFFTIFLFTWPYFTWRMLKRGHLWSDFGPRLGIYSPEIRRRLGKGVDLWIHAVSVGEVMLASVLLRQMRELRPELKVALTTTTQTGYRMAKKLEDARTVVLYNPTDFLWGVISAFETLRPKVVVLIESEIWANYIWCARRRGIPVCLVNTRLSPRTEARYRKLRWFCRPVLREIDLVFAQHPSDIERLVGAGFAPEAIFPVGSLKYEVADLPEMNGAPISSWWDSLGWQAPGNLVLLGGSTHNGEEEILARIYRNLLAEHPSLRLVLAPRHAERGAQVKEICTRLGLSTLLRTELSPFRTGEPPQVLILNTTGELRPAYRKADIVFIGKSLRSKGGQNFIEAARVGVPVLVGPNMQNFSNLTVEFLSRGGMIQVLDEFELAQRLRELVTDTARRTELGERAQAIFASNLGAGKVSARIIAGYLESLVAG